MSRLLWRPAARLALGPSLKPISPPASRGFSASRARLLGDGDDAPVGAGRDERQRATTTRSQQRKVNDRPWQRESSNALPEATSPDPSGGDGTKGRLLTTPTRLLKLILPMPFHPEQEHINASEEKRRQWSKREVEPLALLVHPQQPLSYLERLIQAEMPPVRDDGGRERPPELVFRAEAGRAADSKSSGSKSSGRQPERRQAESSSGSQAESSSSGSQAESSSSSNSSQAETDRHGGANVASYSGLGHEGPGNREARWVRWSGSTEVGDFIRDAARGREFAIGIEGLERELRVAVPSFRDRTYYQRTRLRRMSRQVDGMARVKKECDELAHKGAHRLAKGGFAALAGWWAVVYYVTFHTDLGWDMVEPVTYLAGLGTIMAGYLWFLFISRDLSYKAAMNVTVSRRQTALYHDRGFDPQRWEQLVHEANLLRREIRMAAAEYDVEWDETADLGGEAVREALEAEQRRSRSSRGRDEDEDDDDDDDDDEDGGGGNDHGGRDGGGGGGHRGSKGDGGRGGAAGGAGR